MEREKDSQIIYVKDLLFAILYRWRSVVVCAVICAVLLGGFSLLSQRSNPSIGLSQEQFQEALDAFELEQGSLKESLLLLEDQKGNLELYVQDSPLMKIDPYHVYIAQTTLSFSAPGATVQEQDPMSSLLAAYSDILQDAQIYDALAEKLDVESRYLPELVTIPERDASLRSLRVQVAYPTAEGAQQIMDALVETAKASHSQVEAVCGTHFVSVLSSTVRPQIDIRFSDLQKSVKQRLTDLNTQITSAQTALSGLSAPTAAFGSSISLKKVALFAVIGGFLGCFIAAAVAFVGHLCASRVYSARTLHNATGVQILGCVPGARRKCLLDRWLRKLEGRTVDPQHLKPVAANLRNYCTDKKILVVTEDIDAAQELICALAQAGVQVLSSGSLIYSADALAALPQCDAVLLAAACGISRYLDVLQSVQRITDQNKPLLGCVVIDG